VRPERLTLAELEAASAALDRAVDLTPGIDRFCSRVDWVAPFQRAFGAARETCVFRGRGAFVALARATWPGGRRGLEPLENMWGFACPLLGPESGALLSELTAPGGPLAGEPLWLAGLPDDPQALRPLLAPLAGRFGARAGAPTERCVASLAGGLDGFLARRSRAFRRNLRAARRRGSARGLRFERIRVGPERVDELYARVLAIERRSWKARGGNGADRGPMAEFYRAMWPHLSARGCLRLVLARDGDGREVGYLHGGALDRRFRGLQFSFDDALRDAGLGNLLQLELVDWLCADGFDAYDLGSRSAYKQRWAESLDPTRAVLLVPGLL
jgi:hypothetical protein